MKPEGTEKGRSATVWLWWFKQVGGCSRTLRDKRSSLTPRCDEEATSSEDAETD